MSALNQPLFSKMFLLEGKVTPIPMQTFSPLVLVKLDVIKVNLLEKINNTVLLAEKNKVL